jgi:sugar lactone lactonase YvrE
MIRRTVIALSLFAIAATPASGRSFPEVIALPTGWQPEGIAIGSGHTFYVGSIPTGAVIAGDLRTGMTDPNPLVPAQTGRRAVGLEYDEHGRIFVAGGPTGQGYVYDARTGQSLAEYQFSIGSPTNPTFINDVVVAKDAWFTDSNRPVLYRVQLAPDGMLPESEVQLIRLTGDYAHAAGINLNGIVATPDNSALIAVQTNLAVLYNIDPVSGAAERIELTGGAEGGALPFGDGLLLHGRTLYVVQNRLNRIAIVELAPDLGSGTITGYLTRPMTLDVPTTIARFGRSLYVVNARFGIANPSSAMYTVARVDRN